MLSRLRILKSGSYLLAQRASNSMSPTNLYLSVLGKQKEIIQNIVIRSFCRGPKSFVRGRGGRGDLLPGEVGGATKNYGRLVKPFLFTVTVGCMSYGGAAIWQYEGLRGMLGGDNVFHNNQFYGKSGSLRTKVNVWWNGLMPGERVVVSIAALNVAVFLMWRVPMFNRVMMTYFAGSPMGPSPCASMLLCTFSHHSSFHLFANMYVLWSFTPSATAILGPEQFAATYLTAAVVSGFGSYLAKVVRGSSVPSLGASGAIMSVLGMVCMRHPDARLSIAFVDQILPHSFSAGDAMKGLIVLDTLGILLKWKLFDHAAHLSGMLFGLWYVTYGQKMIWQNKEGLIRRWHSLRSKPPSD